MADEPNGAPDGAPVVPTPPAPTPPAPAPVPVPPSDEAANPSKRDWANAQKELRDVTKKLDTVMAAIAGNGKPTPEPKPTPADTSEVAVLRKEIAFRDAISDSGLPVSPALRKRLQEMYKSASPDDAGAWLAEVAADLGIKKSDPAAPPAAPVPPPQAPPSPNPGAPALKPNLTPDGRNLHQADGQAYKALPLDKRKELATQFLQSGGHQNPTRRVK